MKSQTSIYLSDKDKKRLKTLQEAYETDNVSELIRKLIEQEVERIRFYRELNV